MPISKTVFLFDVDNTLLDNDRVTEDLRRHLESQVGLERAHHYWEIFENLRAELGYADYLGALQRYRIEDPHDPNLFAVSYFLLGYPFANRLFPGSIDAVEHAQRYGTAVILTDGDVVFQPHKVYRSGLYEVFGGKVLIYVHKEQELDHIAQLYPAERYVVLDDKLRILSAIKDVWNARVTTVFVRQGHYALDPTVSTKYPAPDITLDRIGDFVGWGLARLM
ncbi:MAG: HAD family hydrolase [Terriglobia bacterium]|jgi:FMN phosphatase YigB (HAD superfamily)